MASGDTPDLSSDFLPDISYSGLSDTSFDYSGSSTLQDTVVGQPELPLDTSYGNTDASITDLIGTSDPIMSQSLSGVTDPPFGSANYSAPNPSPSPATASLSAGLGALAKFGSGIAALWGGSTAVAQPTSARPVVITNPTQTGLLGQTSGTSLALLLIIAGTLILLISHGGKSV